MLFFFFFFSSLLLYDHRIEKGEKTLYRFFWFVGYVFRSGPFHKMVQHSSRRLSFFSSEVDTHTHIYNHILFLNRYFEVIAFFLSFVVYCQDYYSYGWCCCTFLVAERKDNHSLSSCNQLSNIWSKKKENVRYWSRHMHITRIMQPSVEHCIIVVLRWK